MDWWHRVAVVTEVGPCGFVHASRRGAQPSHLSGLRHIPPASEAECGTHALVVVGSHGVLLHSNMKPLFLAALGGLAVAAAAPAQAAIQKQTVGPVSFSGGLTPTLSFAPFTAVGAANLISVSLTGNSTGTIPPVLSYGGSANVVNIQTGDVSYSTTAAPLFKFNNPGASAFTGTIHSLNLGTVSTPFTSTILNATGTYSGSFNVINTTGSAALQNYFAASPTITMFNPTFTTLVSSPSGAGATISTALTLSSVTPGLYLTYTYDDPTLVPGPLPIAAAGVAFGLSRKLRRRIKTAVA